jgi:hypothetical protein
MYNQLLKKSIKMKTLFTCLVLLVTSTSLLGQYVGDGVKKVERFLDSKTKVILSGDEKFDAQLKKGFEEWWTITEFEYIESREDIDLTDESISYINFYNVNMLIGTTSLDFPRYGIILGGKGSMESQQLAFCLMDRYGREVNSSDITYRIFGMIKMLHDIVLEIKTGSKRVFGGASIGKKTLFNIYNKKNNKIAAKTVLIQKDQLETGPYCPEKASNSMTKDQFLKSYPGKIEFVTKEFIETAILEKNSDYCYILPIYEYRKNYFVVDCETSEIWYAAYTTSGVFFKSGDIKGIYKASQK